MLGPMSTRSRDLVRPHLVVMSYRGGERLRRCLESITDAQHLFDRIVISVTAPENSEDEALAREYARTSIGKAEVLWTGREFPTMEHQAFWVDYLASTGVRAAEWIYWLAYDDQVFGRGIESIVDGHGNWPVEQGTAYFGPWAMRHESADHVLPGTWSEPLETWTSFPIEGPTRLPVLSWVGGQLRQPTYMQMSGSVCTFGSYLDVRNGRPRKRGPMRIEMVTALATVNDFVAEFQSPVSVIYGRPNSDRASYGAAARSEDRHLALWAARYCRASPRRARLLAREASALAAHLRNVRRGLVEQRVEDWVVRGVVQP